jgi:hypothetical protein
VNFEALDVANDARALEKLLALGVRNVPVLAKGEQFIFAQNFEDIAEFVGLQGSDHVPLAPDQLVAKWLKVYSSTQRYIQQLPDERLAERVIANRDRSIRLMGHHIFRIGEAFLETVVDGADYAPLFANKPPPDGEFNSGREIADYGAQVTRRLGAWWDAVQDRRCTNKVPTFFGPQPVHLLLERSTWHSAQHARQLIAVLERHGIEPDMPLTADDLEGLPLPERLWE